MFGVAGLFVLAMCLLGYTGSKDSSQAKNNPTPGPTQTVFADRRYFWPIPVASSPASLKGSECVEFIGETFSGTLGFYYPPFDLIGNFEVVKFNMASVPSNTKSGNVAEKLAVILPVEKSIKGRISLDYSEFGSVSESEFSAGCTKERIAAGLIDQQFNHVFMGDYKQRQYYAFRNFGLRAREALGAIQLFEGDSPVPIAMQVAP